MASIAGFEEKLDGARTRFEASSAALFNSDLPGTWSMVAQEEHLDSGGIYALIDTGQTGIMRKWVGDKQRDSFRMYRKNVLIDVWEKTFGIKRRELIDDTTSAINRKIDTWLSSQAQVFDYKVWEKILENPTGIDGVALFNNTHPYGADSGTWDNLTTDALSFAAYNSAKIAMRTLKGEAGRFMGLRPTHLFVGPALERTAKELVGADRPVAVGTNSAIDGVVGGATTLGNVYQGDVTVVVSEHFANGTNDNDWFLLDSTKGAMPICLVRQRDPELIELTDMTDTPRFTADEFVWSVEADFGVDGAYPHVVYGKLT